MANFRKAEDAKALIDYFSIALTHGLILLACWRLLQRDDLDVEGAGTKPDLRPWLKQQERAEDA